MGETEPPDLSRNEHHYHLYFLLLSRKKEIMFNYLPFVTCHMSPTSATTTTDAPHAVSPTMHIRLVC